MKSLNAFLRNYEQSFEGKQYAVAGAITRKWDDGKALHVVGTITFSGNYAANGDTFNFTASLTDSQPGSAGLTTNKQPYYVDIKGKAGFIYTYDYVNQKILVFLNTAGGANAALGEHTAAGYVAGITGDVVTFYAIFPKF